MPAPAEDRFFAEHGWMVVRGLVPPERVAALRAAVDALIPEAAYATGFAGRIVEVAGISRGSPEIARHAAAPALGELAAAALGARRVQLLQDTALIKPPAGGPVEWHQDQSYLGYLDRAAVVTVRLALSPCTERSGCLRVIDGSHRRGLHTEDLSFRRTSVEDTLAALPPELRGAEVALELAPGDVSVHHCLTYHGSGVNRTAAPRKTLVVRLMDAECRRSDAPLPEAIRAHFPVDAAGRLSTTRFPVTYERPAGL